MNSKKSDGKRRYKEDLTYDSLLELFKSNLDHNDQ